MILWKNTYEKEWLKKMRKIIKAELIMLIGEIKQYYVNYIFYNLGMIILFCGIFYNYFSDKNDNLVLAMLISAVLWQISTNAIQYYSYLIQDEAMMGTLEQMFLSKTSFHKIIISKTIVNMGFVIIKGGFLFLVCMLFFCKQLSDIHINFIQLLMILCIFSVTVIVFYGIGGLFGGLSLYFKRISAVINVINYFLLMFTGILKDPMTYAKNFAICIRLLPITNANILIGEILANETKKVDILCFVISCLIFLLAGIVGMNTMIKLARKDGKLGQY